MKKIKLLLCLAVMLFFVGSGVYSLKAEEVVEPTEDTEEVVENKSSLALLFEEKTGVIITALSSAVTALGVIAAFIKIVNAFLKKKLELAKEEVEKAKNSYELFKVEAYQHQLEFQNKASELQLKFDETLNDFVSKSSEEIRLLKAETTTMVESFEEAFNQLKEEMKYVESVKADVETALKDITFQTELLKVYLLSSKNNVSEGISRRVKDMVDEYEGTKERSES